MIWNNLKKLQEDCQSLLFDETQRLEFPQKGEKVYNFHTEEGNREKPYRWGM